MRDQWQYWLNGESTTRCSGTPNDNLSLMDGGANICITGILGLLVDAISIPPLPISVATQSGEILHDDCCTKRGLLPLTLADGSLYYQTCYYCKNAVETIISLEAIVAGNNALVHWTQSGRKGNEPVSIKFSSDSGLYSFTSTWKSGRGSTSTLQTCLRWIVTLVGLIIPPFAAPWHPHQQRCHDGIKNSPQSQAIPLRSRKCGCYTFDPRVKTNWIYYWGMLPASLLVFNTIHSAL
jgi:hypothetical protein